MSFFRRLIGALGASSQGRHGVQVGDRYVKTDGQYQTTWVVRQIVYFEGIPPHARLANDHEYDLGYRTISVVALADPELYRPAAPESGRIHRGNPGPGRTGGPSGGRRPAMPRLNTTRADADNGDVSSAAMHRHETALLPIGSDAPLRRGLPTKS